MESHLERSGWLGCKVALDGSAEPVFVLSGLFKRILR